MVSLLEPNPPRRRGSAIIPGLDSNWLHGPIRATGPLLTVPVEHRASVAVLRVEDDGSLTTLGTLTASSSRVPDGCHEHCPAWIANTQAFPREHDVIAVLGYEIVRARIGGDRIEETDRLDLLATLGT